VRQAGRTLSAASRTGRCSKAGLCRALGVTPYLLERWRSASPSDRHRHQARARRRRMIV
jgi:hypothetical protein